MNDRPVIRTDADLINETGIIPADHDYSTPLVHAKLRRQILGPFTRRAPETEEQKQARLRRPFGWR